MNALKQCTVCKRMKVASDDKIMSEFYWIRGVGRFNSACKPCQRLRAERAKAKKPEEKLKYNKAEQRARWRTVTQADGSEVKERRCTRCEQWKVAAEVKDISEFYIKKDGKFVSACKACSVQQCVGSQKKNPAGKLKNGKDYYMRHQEALTAKNRSAWVVHAKERHAARKVWYQQNKDTNLAYQATWREEHREAIRAKGRVYQKAHPEVYRASWYRRRARKRNAVGTASHAQIQARIDYYGGRCWMCGKPYEVVDHVIPLCRGGTNWPANLRPACRNCNQKKGRKLPSAVVPTC